LSFFRVNKWKNFNYFREVWESTRKFGNVKNFYAPKISFSKYIEVMIKEEKFEMAR
jgi:hypothetical protein